MVINCESNVPAELIFEGSIECEKGTGDATSGPAKLKLLANTGTPMRPRGFEVDVIMDMAGVSFAQKKTPIIADHDVKLRIGHALEQSVNAEALAIEVKGIASSNSQTSKDVVADMKNDFPFQVSVGASVVPGTMKSIRAGQKVQVNGKEWTGPLLVAGKTVINEYSVLVLGADPKTSATLAASLNGDVNLMNPEFLAYLDNLGIIEAEYNAYPKTRQDKLKAGFDASQVAPVAKPAPAKAGFDAAAFRDEIATITTASKALSSIVAKYSPTIEAGTELLEGGKKYTVESIEAAAIREGWTPERLEVVMLRAERANGLTSKENRIEGSPYIQVTKNLKDRADLSDIIACAIVKQTSRLRMEKDTEDPIYAQQQTVEDWYSDQILQAADHKLLNNFSLHQLYNLVHLQANGHYYGGNTRTDDFIQSTRKALQKLDRLEASGSGFSNVSVSYIFENVAHKLLLAGYQSINTTWQEFVAVESVSDFKTNSLYRLTIKDSYSRVGADGQLKHGGFSDEKFSIDTDTFGKIVGLNRKQQINDDMNAFRSIFQSLGIESAKAKEELCYVHMLTNHATIWSSGNANLITGSDTVLGTTGLDLAETSFSNQVDSDNSPIGLNADRVLVGTNNRRLAWNLFNKQTFALGNSSEKFQDNDFVGRYRPIVSPYLNNTAIKRRIEGAGTSIGNQSANHWWMFPTPASASRSTLVLAVLNGKRTPVLEKQDAAFEYLGTQFRAYDDFDINTVDPKFSLRSKGSA